MRPGKTRGTVNQGTVNWGFTWNSVENRLRILVIAPKKYKSTKTCSFVKLDKYPSAFARFSSVLRGLLMMLSRAWIYTSLFAMKSCAMVASCATNFMDFSSLGVYTLVSVARPQARRTSQFVGSLQILNYYLSYLLDNSGLQYNKTMIDRASWKSNGRLSLK